MIFPTVHLNGTSRAALIEELENAYSAIDTAMRALAQAAPNGRDYYPQGADAIYKAQDEHRERQRRLDSVKQELEQLIENIDAQGK